MTLRAISRIDKDTEIFISYYPLPARKEVCAAHCARSGFHCTCELCVLDENSQRVQNWHKICYEIEAFREQQNFVNQGNYFWADPYQTIPAVYQDELSRLWTLIDLLQEEPSLVYHRLQKYVSVET